MLTLNNMLLIIFISYFMVMLSFINSPLLGALFLIIISMLMSLFMSHLMSKWIGFLVILLFLGGMMVLFVYISTLISSMKSFLSNSYSNLMLACFSGAISFMYLAVSQQNILYDCKEMLLSILYLKSNFSFMSICAVYLLLVLIISIKISQKFKGSMKSKMQD